MRYQNPLPAPPFPPKLLNIPTTPARYVQQGSEFTAALAKAVASSKAADSEEESGEESDAYEYDDDMETLGLPVEPSAILTKLQE